MKTTDFKNGGTVKILRGGDVKVHFDKPTPTGRASVGVYDELWFRVYPHGLELLFPPTDTEERVT